MFPAMSPAGARSAIAWCVATRIFAGIDAGRFGDGKPAKYVPMTTQQAIDAVCARVRSR